MAESMRFRLKDKVGDHFGRDEEGNEVRYTPGDVVESEEDLRVKYPGKFDRVYEEDEVRPVRKKKAGTGSSSPSRSAKKGAKKGTKKKTAKKKTAPKEEVVTDQFPAAAEEGLTVKKRGSAYIVLDGTDKVNEGTLKSKTAVEKFLADYA